MKGNYHRYLAGFKTSSDRKDAEEHAMLAYDAAQVSTASNETPVADHNKTTGFTSLRVTMCKLQATRPV
jgi:hypothetical protein